MTAEETVAPLSVVIPTIGRPALLRACLESITGCDPRPAEVLVVDQSGDGATAAVVSDFGARDVRHVSDDRRGASAAQNRGLREAAHHLVAVTNDDCTVAPDWVGQALALATANPGAVISGQVLPGGDRPDGVPSTKVDPTPHDYTGELVLNALYGGNMVLPRDEALAIGGFDEATGLRLAAEDNDFCYRWLRDGRSLRYEPALRVWHHDWRSPEQLRRRYIQYSRGNGALYAKHLLRGDLRMLSFAVRELRWGLRGLAGAVKRRSFDPTDTRLGILVGLPYGFVLGLLDELAAKVRRRRAVPEIT